MVKGAALLLVAAIGGAVSGCDDPPPVSSIDSVCEGACRGFARCDIRVSWQSCYNGCRVDPRNARFSDIRPEAAAVVGPCLSELDCETILNNGPIDTCWDRGRAQTPPSAHLLDFCEAYATSLYECGYWFSVEDCQTKLNIWSDEVLDAAAACTQQTTCEVTDACLENVFGGG